MTDTAPSVPLSFFDISFGLLGLAVWWRVAAGFGLVPLRIGRLLALVAMLVWAVVGDLQMGSAQLRLFPVSLRLNCMPSFWSFAFTWPPSPSPVRQHEVLFPTLVPGR